MANPKTYARKLIKPDGTIVDYPSKGKTYTLKELQAAVEGYIEVVSLPDGQHLMVVNEEGKLDEKERKQMSTQPHCLTLNFEDDPVVFQVSDDQENLL